MARRELQVVISEMVTMDLDIMAQATNIITLTSPIMELGTMPQVTIAMVTI